MEIFLFWFSIVVLFVCCGTCRDVLRNFIGRPPGSKKAGQDQVAPVITSFSTTQLSLPESAWSDVVRGYDSPEVSRHDTLIRIGLFLQTAKRPAGVE
jgi:hypothetical protein